MPDMVWIPREIARNALLAILGEFSEESWCAGWMHGLEVGVWAVLQGDRPNDYGQSTLSESDQKSLRLLSEALGEWPLWDDESHEPTWLPLAEWTERYAASLTPATKAAYAERWAQARSAEEGRQRYA